MMALSKWLLNWFFGIKSPSVHFATIGKQIEKGFNQGIKIAGKEFVKYQKIRQKFESKWYKQNENWVDGRHKRKACQKAFVKAYPKYRLYIQMERLGNRCIRF